MNDAFIMEVPNSLNNLTYVFFSFSLGEPFFFLQQGVEVVVTKFSYNVHVVTTLVHIMKFNNILMFHRFQNFDLTLDTL